MTAFCKKRAHAVNKQTSGATKRQNTTSDRTTPAPRVTSKEWIDRYRQHSLDEVPFHAVFDDGNASPCPAFLSGGFIPDNMLGFLQRSEDRADIFLNGINTPPRRPTCRGTSADWIANTKNGAVSFDAVPYAAIFSEEERDKEGSGEEGDGLGSSSTLDQPQQDLLDFLSHMDESATDESNGSGMTTAKSTPATLGGGTDGTAGQETTPFCEPNESDVLCGRGGRSNNHPGNQRYLEEVQNLKSWYKSSDKVQKTDLSQLLVNYVHSYGGRFLRLDKSTKKWYEVENIEARKKASQALREQDNEKTQCGEKTKRKTNAA